MAFQLYDDGYCAGATGTDFATNNYVQKFRRVVSGNTTARLKMVNNTAWEFGLTACAYGICGAGASDLNTTSGVIGVGSTGNTTQDCRLVSTLNGDWHLQPDAGSTCQDTAFADPLAPVLDLDGDARPLGSALDRGADETP